MEVFDRNFRESLERRFTGRPPWEQPDLADVALSSERADVRTWLDTEITALPPPGREKLLARLRDDNSFSTAYNELAAASVLRQSGLGVLYEPRIHALTPDLFVPSTPDARPMVVEVWTRAEPQASRGERRAWGELVHRIATIPVPVGLIVQAVTGSAPSPPSSGEAKRLAVGLQHWLLRSSRRPRDTCDIDDYRFTVVMTVPGPRARLAPPLQGGWVDSELVVRAIREKVRRYKELTDHLDATLVIITASDPSAPLDLDLLRNAVGGRQSFSFSFSPGASGLIGEWSGQMISEESQVGFDSALSAVGFVDARLADPLLTLIRMPGARRALGSIESPRLTIED